MKKYITSDQLKTVVHAYVTSILDQNNSLLKGQPKTALQKLTRIQNAAARAITGVKKHDHITCHLRDLHWLPIPYRIDFKILLLVFKTLNGKGPEYLNELLVPYVPSRSLRSSSSNNLVVPRVHSVAGERSFSYSAPKRWNELPQNIKNSQSINALKTALKTYYFDLAYLY